MYPFSLCIHDLCVAVPTHFDLCGLVLTATQPISPLHYAEYRSTPGSDLFAFMELHAKNWGIDQIGICEPNGAIEYKSRHS